MATGHTFDVIVVGGGIAGSCLGGVLARSGLSVLVVEKEPRFRDRIRGECTWPYGVADARRVGLQDLLDRVGVVSQCAYTLYENRHPVANMWELETDGDVPAMGFVHPQLQEAAFGWAAEQGAATLRPAKATRFAHDGQPSLIVTVDGHEAQYDARLIVGADGKQSGAHRWTGGKSTADPEHHRMGGVLVSGATIDRERVNYFWTPGIGVVWLPAGPEMTRLYLILGAAQLNQLGADRSFDALVAFAAEYMPEGALADAQQAGPIGFFPNNDIWASQIAGNDVVLIGDAAGAPDPTQGHGTALLFRDVRALSELLLATTDWDTASTEYAAQRRRYFEVIRAGDRWTNIFFETSEEARRLHEGHERARQHDPTLGGFAMLEKCGPDGLVADEAARRHYFGEDLA
jgi:menaquinone-9 beta-reductase